MKLHQLPLQTVHQLILVISHCTHYLVGMATASLQLEKRPEYNTGPSSWRPNNLQWSQIIQQNIRRQREHVVSPEEQVVGGMAADHCAPGETVSPPTPLPATSPPSAGGNQQFSNTQGLLSTARNTNMIQRQHDNARCQQNTIIHLKSQTKKYHTISGKPKPPT